MVYFQTTGIIDQERYIYGLDQGELTRAIEAATAKITGAMAKGWIDATGMQRRRRLLNNIVGAIGELAAAHLLGFEYAPVEGNNQGADIGPEPLNLQVRASERLQPPYDLIGYPSDIEKGWQHSRFIKARVIYSERHRLKVGQAAAVQLIGWAWGYELFKDEYRKSKGVDDQGRPRPANYWLPESRLHRMQALELSVAVV